MLRALFAMACLSIGCGPSVVAPRDRPPRPMAPSSPRHAAPPVVIERAELSAPVVVGGEGGRTRVVVGPMRVEVTGSSASVATDELDGSINHVAEVRGGWVFASAEGLVARSDTFLGPLRVIGELSGSLEGVPVSVSRGQLWLPSAGGFVATDGGPLRPVAPPPFTDHVVFTSIDRGAAWIDGGTTAHTEDGGRTWTAEDRPDATVPPIVMRDGVLHATRAEAMGALRATGSAPLAHLDSALPPELASRVLAALFHARPELLRLDAATRTGLVYARSPYPGGPGTVMLGGRVRYHVDEDGLAQVVPFGSRLAGWWSHGGPDPASPVADEAWYLLGEDGFSRTDARGSFAPDGAIAAWVERGAVVARAPDGSEDRLEPPSDARAAWVHAVDGEWLLVGTETPLAVFRARGEEPPRPATTIIACCQLRTVVQQGWWVHVPDGEWRPVCVEGGDPADAHLTDTLLDGRVVLFFSLGEPGWIAIGRPGECPRAVPLPVGVSSVGFRSADDGIALVDGGRLLFTDDGGAQWHELEVSLPSDSVDVRCSHLGCELTDHEPPWSAQVRWGPAPAPPPRLARSAPPVDDRARVPRALAVEPCVAEALAPDARASSALGEQSVRYTADGRVTIRWREPSSPPRTSAPSRVALGAGCGRPRITLEATTPAGALAQAQPVPDPSPECVGRWLWLRHGMPAREIDLPASCIHRASVALASGGVAILCARGDLVHFAELEPTGAVRAQRSYYTRRLAAIHERGGRASLALLDADAMHRFELDAPRDARQVEAVRLMDGDIPICEDVEPAGDHLTLPLLAAGVDTWFPSGRLRVTPPSACVETLRGETFEDELFELRAERGALRGVARGPQGARGLSCRPERASSGGEP